jgi:hypothetical protein
MVGIVTKIELYNLHITAFSAYVIYISYLDMFGTQRMIVNVLMEIQIICVLGKVNIFGCMKMHTMYGTCFLHAIHMWKYG